jgi:peptidoglycan hydrolase-like protein with peptidoglycan-binding domain
MIITLNKPFAANSPVDEFDVRQMKKALNRLGYYQPFEKTGITGIPDAQVFAALRKFQTDQGLPATGAAKPDDETVKALSRAAGQKQSGAYIWRTVGDDKVRGDHAALNGTQRDFSDSPDPGEDFNCRCWAEAITKKKCEEEELEYVNANAELYIIEQSINKALVKLEALQNNLREIEKNIQKEKHDTTKAKIAGATIGAAIGGTLASPAGPGSAAIGAQLGLGTGGQLGKIAEELIDAVSDENTSIYLDKKKKELNDSILKLKNEIQNKKEAYKNAKKRTSLAQEVLALCKEKHSG